jgi:hypothetical protein
MQHVIIRFQRFPTLLGHGAGPRASWLLASLTAANRYQNLPHPPQGGEAKPGIHLPTPTFRLLDEVKILKKKYIGLTLILKIKGNVKLSLCLRVIN